MKRYLEKIIDCDYQAIKEAIFPELAEQIRTFVNNKYVYQPFWTHHNKEQGRRQDWERDYNSDIEAAQRAISRGHPKVLCELFDRLYTLRNQLLHGGATWKSSVNRNQVGEPGARIMSSLVPHFIEVMIEHPNDWGPVLSTLSGGSRERTAVRMDGHEVIHPVRNRPFYFIPRRAGNLSPAIRAPEGRAGDGHASYPLLPA